MKNTIIDGKEYAVNLKGEQYEVMIPGTKCPVSIGVLEQWYWKEGLSGDDISVRIENNFSVKYGDEWIYRVLRKNGIALRGSKQASLIRKKNKGDTYTGLRRGGGNNASFDVLEKNRKKAIKAWVSICANKRTSVKCAMCNKVFSVRPSKKHQECCSNSCAATLRHQRRILLRPIIIGIICPSCKCPTLYARGYQRLPSGSICRFACAACRSETHEPIIELGLRQDLEAAGALDDGRILASAFVTEKEKATAS